MKHPARVAAILAGVCVLAFAVVLAVNVGNDPSEEARTSELFGKAAPAFDLPTLDGSRVTLDGLVGKVVVVNFWNTWCAPCQEEHPALKRFYARHQNDADFAMVGIVRDDTRAAVRKWVAAEDIGWTIAIDPDSLAALDFGTRGQPETYVISPGGQIVASKFGAATVPELETMLATGRRS